YALAAAFFHWRWSIHYTEWIKCQMLRQLGNAYNAGC
ncbi:MAG: hypothetical protein ACI8W9_001323, partial [Psychromonas sp.]